MRRIEHIGERIATIRKNKELTQEKLVEKIGEENMSLSTLKRIESGKTTLSAVNLIRICLALDCKVSDVLPDDDKRTKIKQLYQSDEDESEVESLLMLQPLFFPETPNSFLYQNHKIQNMLQLLIYLPLMNQRLLQDCLWRIGGEAFGNELYTLWKLDLLYSRIPESDAKAYADMMASKCTTEYFVEYHSSPITELDEEWLDESTWPRLLQMREAYDNTIQNMF